MLKIMIAHERVMPLKFIFTEKNWTV